MTGLHYLLLIPLLAQVAWGADAPRPVLVATDFNVLSDGSTLNTAAIQRAIDTCATGGGGTLRFPAGRYLTGTVRLKDGVTLRLDEGAVLLGSTRAADYLNVDPFTDGTGATLGFALVVAVDSKDVGIEGPGTIDGQGKSLAANQKPYAVRPFLVRWVRCRGVSVRDVHLRNAGAWTMHFFQSTDTAVERVTIRSHGLANNDGIDIDSCDDVRVTDCDIDTDDDAVCLKATSPLPCRNVRVTGCTLKSRCATIKMGTESVGDFTDVRVSRCRITGAGLGGIKLFSVDGARVRDVTLSDISMDNVRVPVMIRLGARLRTFRPGDEKKPVGSLGGVMIKNIRATGASQIGILVSGLPGYRVEDVSFENVTIDLPGGGTEQDARAKLPEKPADYPEVGIFGNVMPAYGLYARHVNGLHVKHVKFNLANSDARPSAVLEDAEDVTPQPWE